MRTGLGNYSAVVEFDQGEPLVLMGDKEGVAWAKRMLDGVIRGKSRQSVLEEILAELKDINRNLHRPL